MRKYLAYYENEWPANIAELTAVKNKPFVGYLKNEEVRFTVIPKPADPNTYVTFTAEEASSTIGLAKLSANQTLEYSTDSLDWTSMDTSTTLTLENAGDKVYVRGILRADNTASDYTNFTMSGKISASGNCNALWDYENLDAPLKAFCGYAMFYYCNGLTTAPELPSTDLAESCYDEMFSWCRELIAAPALPATKLAVKCYGSMFNGCTNLTTVPVFAAEELAEYCCRYMFRNCSSLQEFPDSLPATTLSPYCYQEMFSGCEALANSPALPATTLAIECYRNMFSYCKSLTTAPELPAVVLADGCYYNMFTHCS